MMNIDRYIRQSVRRELAAHRYRDGLRRRHIDRRVYAIRHNDDIKDIFLKIKALGSKLVDFLKGHAPQIAKIVAGAVVVASAVFAGKAVADMKGSVRRLEQYKSQIENAASQMNSAQTMESLDPEELQMAQGNFESRRKEIASTALARNAFAVKSVKTKALLKTFASLLGVFIGLIGFKLSRS